MDQRHIVRAKTIKSLGKKIGQKLHDIGFDNDFLNMTWKAQAAKEKIDKSDFVKFLKFCASLDDIKSKKVTHRMDY